MIKLFAYTAKDLIAFVAGPTMSRSTGCSTSILAFNFSGTERASEWDEFEEQPAPKEPTNEWDEFEEQPLPGLEKEKPKKEQPKKPATTIPLRCVVDFSTHCSASKNTWQQRAVLDDVGSISKNELGGINNFEDLAKFPEVLNGNIHVGCNCPSFVFWGNAYEIDSVDSGEGTLTRYKNNPHPETRAPTKNVQLPGFLCKHLISVLAKYFT